MANATVQDRWRFCSDCFALHFIGNIALGVCPAGGAHSPAGSGDYVLLLSSDADFDNTVTGQRDWRFCHKCRSLWFNGQTSNGVCPAGGSHSASQSGDYSLIVQGPDFDSGIFAQRDWRFCSDCFVLWFNGEQSNGVCPAGGGHTRSGSGDYALTVDVDTVFN